MNRFRGKPLRWWLGTPLYVFNKVTFPLRRRIDWRRGLDNANSATNGEERLLRSLLPRCEVVFDVGANTGEWSLLALKIKQSLTLTSVEPDPDTFAVLSKVVPPSVKLLNCALGDSPGTAMLYRSGRTSEHNSLHMRAGVHEGGSIQVQIKRLDDLTEEQIDFLKIDCEGNDVAVLRGARGLFQACKVRFAQVEYGPFYPAAGATMREIFEFAGSVNYTLYRLYPRGLIALPAYSDKLETFIYQNLLLVAPSENAPLRI